MNPQLAEGSDESKLIPELGDLLDSGWKLNAKQNGVSKTYHFKAYTKVLDFHHVIGVRSKAKNHHPVMTTETGSLTVAWTTHHPRGLSAKDTFMARYCDEHAGVIGTVERSDAQKCWPSGS